MTWLHHRKRGLQRIATEQIEQAIAVFANFKLHRHEAVHQAHVHCKRLRALLQLLRNIHPDLARFENASIRDAAAQLAYLRDTAFRTSYLALLSRINVGEAL